MMAAVLSGCFLSFLPNGAIFLGLERSKVSSMRQWPGPSRAFLPTCMTKSETCANVEDIGSLFHRQRAPGSFRLSLAHPPICQAPCGTSLLAGWKENEPYRAPWPVGKRNKAGLTKYPHLSSGTAREASGRR